MNRSGSFRAAFRRFLFNQPGSLAKVDATGEWTILALLCELELRGLTNTPTTKYPVRPVRLSHLYAILRHPYYKGEIVWRGARHAGRPEPLVDEATWAEVQKVLSAHGPGEKQRTHPHYLKSTVYCGGCGSRLIITNTKNRHGQVYLYFVCVGRHQKRTECYRKTLLIADVEVLVEQFYVDFQLPKDLRERIESSLRRELAASRTHIDAELRTLIVQQERLVHERTKLLQAH